MLTSTMSHENIGPHFQRSNCNKGSHSQWAFTCSKLTKERLEQGVKYAQS